MPTTKRRRGNVLKMDPSRTVTLRRAFTARVRRKFMRLKAEILRMVGQEDAFGLGEPNIVRNSLTDNRSRGAVMAMVSDQFLADSIRAIQGAIDPADVIKLEERPHVTIKYGLMDHSWVGQKVANYFGGRGPVKGRLSGLGLFRNPDADVLRFDVTSDQLRELNEAVGLLDNDDAHPDYVPHLTVAYLRPGTGDRWVQQTRIDGTPISFDQVLYSPADGEETVVNAFCPTGPGGGIDNSCSPVTPGESPWGDEAAIAKSIGLPTTYSGKDDRFGAKGYHWAVDNPLPQSSVMTFKGIQAMNPDVIKKGKGEPREFDISDLKSAQDYVQPSAIEGVIKNTRLNTTPIIAKIKDEYVILNGNHTVLGKKLSGDTKVKTTYLGDITDKIDFTANVAVNAGRFAFKSSPQQVEEFKKWVKKQLGSTVVGKSDQQLWEAYARDGFKRGAGRAFDDIEGKKSWLKKGDYDFYAGGKEQFLRSSFGRPETADKIKLLASRSFEDLKNVTGDMATKMGRVLTDGLARGAHPKELAKELAEEVDVGARRAEVIARTEIIRAHAEGQLDAFEKLGVEEVGVAVEWSTAGDDRVCDECAPLEGAIFKIDQAHGMIPRHPQCRCAFIPANVGEDKEDQVRDKAGIREAIRESLDAADQTLADWGPAKAIRGDAPAGILGNAFLLTWERMTDNAFCPTGEGGGVDPTCSPGSGSSSLPTPEVLRVEVSGHLIEVHKNPTKEGLERWLKNKGLDDQGNTAKQEHEIRGFVLDDDAYFWDSSDEGEEMYHNDVASKIVGIDYPMTSGRFVARINKGELKLQAYASVRTLRKWAEKRNITANQFAANVFCPTGPGGGVDPSCSPGGGGVTAPVPKFIDKAHAAGNIKASNEIKALAEAGDLAGLKAHPGTPSPKVKEYKAKLIAKLEAKQGGAKAPPAPAPAKPAETIKSLVAKAEGYAPGSDIEDPPQSSYQPAKPGGFDAAKVVDSVVSSTGLSKQQIKDGLVKDTVIRAKVADAILKSGTQVDNAILLVQNQTTSPESIKAITKGDPTQSIKELGTLPAHDVAILRGIDAKAGPVSGEAVAYIATREIAVGTTTRPGSYRHELGHVLRAAMGGTSHAGKTELTKAVAVEFEKSKARMAADPKGLKEKHSEEWFEGKYGIISGRGADNFEEYFAEHYRGYHRELFRDKHETGGGRRLTQYRARHPGMAKVFDAHYTAALISEHLAKEGS